MMQKTYLLKFIELLREKGVKIPTGNDDGFYVNDFSLINHSILKREDALYGLDLLEKGGFEVLACEINNKEYSSFSGNINCKKKLEETQEEYVSRSISEVRQYIKDFPKKGEPKAYYDLTIKQSSIENMFPELYNENRKEKDFWKAE